jgi:hypothetical protein
MTPEDRELLQSLRRQQAELQQALSRLDAQVGDLEARSDAVVKASLPPIPEHPPLPPIPDHSGPPPFVPSIPPAPESFAHLPPIPKPPVRAPKPSFDFHFGRWLMRIGPVFGVIALALIFSSHAVHAVLGAAGLIGLSTLVSLFVTFLGGQLERKKLASVFFGRVVTFMGLAWLYFTAYAACYSPAYQIIQSPIAAGILLLMWSGYVFALAQRKHSLTLALLAIALAYFSTEINPVGRFMLGADLFLAGMAVLLLVRNGWSAVAYVSLICTYMAVFRRLVVDADGEFVFDAGRTLHFWPYAIYVTAAWVLFTAAIWFASDRSFRRTKRLVFLSLNNGAWVGLLLYTAYISGYGHGAMGWIFFLTGLVMLVTSRFIGWSMVEPERLMADYAAQGLGLFTAGLIVLFTGMTRAVMLSLETLLLGCAGTFAADRILLVTTYISAGFATMFLVWEISVNAHHPWILGWGAGAIMLLNAWMARSDIRHSPNERSTVVGGSAYYCTLACILFFAGLCTAESDYALPPALSLTALGLTFFIYYFLLYELPPIAQALQLAALALVIFPIDNGEAIPWWTTFWVVVATLILLTWWSRQRITRTSSWTSVLTLLYSLGLAALTYETIRPWFNLEGWMVIASLLSIVFLIWGAMTRVWAMAVAGQLFLAMALYHFFLPPGEESFPWAWWAAAVPMVVVFSTARAAHVWLDLTPLLPEVRRKPLRALAYSYQLLALGMLIIWVSALVPTADQVGAFLFLGTFSLSWCIRIRSLFGIRCSYVFTVLGILLFLRQLNDTAGLLVTPLNGFAFLSVLLQPMMLKRARKTHISPWESWAVVLWAVGSGLLFITTWVAIYYSPGYLTMNWALYGLFLFLVGPFLHERRYRWCGLALLVMAIGRAALHDFWNLSHGHRILTFLVLTITTLIVGYLTVRSAEKMRH